MIIGNSPDYCSWNDRANSFDNKSRVPSKLESGLGNPAARRPLGNKGINLDLLCPSRYATILHDLYNL
jgi:hypothetical protein